MGDAAVDERPHGRPAAAGALAADGGGGSSSATGCALWAVSGWNRAGQVPMCMLCARDAPDQRFRGIEGQICCPGESVLPSRQCFGLL